MVPIFLGKVVSGMGFHLVQWEICVEFPSIGCFSTSIWAAQEGRNTSGCSTGHQVFFFCFWLLLSLCMCLLLLMNCFKTSIWAAQEGRSTAHACKHSLFQSTSGRKIPATIHVGALKGTYAVHHGLLDFEDQGHDIYKPTASHQHHHAMPR